ncbi:GntR family transcriptional regulator [Tritonibacter scottomollicae]|uniref:GntR family transcriptional regulator n=1 Tax=Tritonibacter scottomollicae TaxID=483013 RepID=A0A2T1AB31_TRISK|nr:GntR family transcriptional regulator [Tritonibacter scottomollicae]PRZ45791.1 GntR family transcriptional regulator [Tritonibacter scottomollicae]
MLFSRRPTEDDTVVAMLASAIRRDISFGTLRPDEKLKIEALRQRYGGSNHSMRETLRMLVSEGMVEATNQRGFRVTSATEDDLADILLMRLEVEKLALTRAMVQGGVDWEASVVASHHQMMRAEDQVRQDPNDVSALEWDEACRTHMLSLIAACNSPRLIDMAGRFYDQSRRFRLARLREGRIAFKARRTRHETLKTAIMDRDTQRALALLEEDIRADLRG